MKTIFKKIFSIMLMLCLLAAGSSGIAEEVTEKPAEGDIDLNATGSLTLTLLDNTEEHNPVPGGTFALYKVGEARIEANNLCFTLVPDFADSGVDISDLSAEGIAASLAEYAADNNIAGTVKQADENGTVVFDNLSVGLYLLTQEGSVTGFYPMDPFIFSIPMMNADGTGWIYDIAANPKVQAGEPTPPELRDLTVKKVWSDESNASRPSSVTIELYCDGELYDTVVLSAENNWTHTWTGLEKNHSWTVKENPVPSGYIVSYDYSDGIVVVVTNTQKLIQTGQLKWPVPVLIGTGILLLMLGLVLKLSCRRRTEEKD